MVDHQSARLKIATAAGTLALGLFAGPSAPRIQAATRAPAPFVTYTPAIHTATVRLIAGYTSANAGYNFDGGATGAIKITVPLGTKVVATFTDNVATPLSALIIPFSAGVTATPPAPAFPGAASADYHNGTEKGDPASIFTFHARTAGTYRIVCGVPGHDVAGMWDLFVVSRSARTATFHKA